MTNAFFDYFDRAYVVNLPYRTDRLREVTRELSEAGFPLTPGRIEVFPAVRPEDKGKFPTIGARGCFHSHLGILKRARAEGVERLLVMEDDVALSSAWRDHSPRLIEEMERAGWDMVYFGHVLVLDPSAEPGLIPWMDEVRTTHMFAVHGRIIEPLVAFLEAVDARPPGHPDGGPMHVDGAFSTFRRQNPSVRTLVAAPSLGGQRASRTDIHDLAFYDRWPGLRGLAQWARRVKRSLT